MKVMRTPKSLDLAITNRCNLRCLYCYHFDGSGDAGKAASSDGGGLLLWVGADRDRASYFALRGFSGFSSSQRIR